MAQLLESDVKKILAQAVEAANKEMSGLRVDKKGNQTTTKMHVIVVNRSGKVVGQSSMDDAWIGSISIARSKAYTAAAFSSDENAMSSRAIGLLSQPGGQLWQIGNSNTAEGIIEFPGGFPLYKGGALVGAIGVSGDGVDQDENVAFAGTKGFEPDNAITIDNVTNKAVAYKK